MCRCTHTRTFFLHMCIISFLRTPVPTKWCRSSSFLRCTVFRIPFLPLPLADLVGVLQLCATTSPMNPLTESKTNIHKQQTTRKGRKCGRTSLLHFDTANGTPPNSGEVERERGRMREARHLATVQYHRAIFLAVLYAGVSHA
jgi:hypothetical protein